MENKNEAITSREKDFAQWYTDVCRKADLMDYASTKGFINYLPYSYAMWEEIQTFLNRKFKEIGVQNVYLPTLIPSSLFNKEKEHIEGFAPECLVATIGGGNELADPLIIRPTSEVLFCDLYRRRLSSYRDLPLMYNQWCSVVRWEKTTRPFLRGSEFLWQEGHCLFETADEAKTNALWILEKAYDALGKELLAIPFIKGRKTEHEKFAGAKATYTIEALMHDGKALQCGTTHDFGQDFAASYGISYQGRNNALVTPYQTSWGVSTRLLGAIIMVHGDDNGLVLPPYVAPIQVVIVPIRQKEPVILETCHRLAKEIAGAGIRVKVDDDESKTPGWKFAEYEMKGVPLRIEIGPRDLEKGVASLTKRVNGEKSFENLSSLALKVPFLLKEIHETMYQKAEFFLSSHITEASNIDELKEKLCNGGYVKMAFCGEEDCESKIKEITLGGTARCIASYLEKESHTCCPVCGKKARIIAYFAKAY